MRFFDFVSVRLTLCLVSGIILGFYLEIRPAIPFYSLVGLLPLLFWAKQKQARKGFPFFELTTILTTFFLGVFIVNLSQSRQLRHHYAQTELTQPKLWKIKIREVLKPNAFSQRYVGKVLAVENEKASGKIILSLPNDSTSTKLKFDEELYVVAKAETIKPPLNPHQFNYKDFLEKQRIYHQLRITQKQFVLQKNPPTTILGIASNFREHLISKLKKENFGSEELSVIQALLLGQRDDISASTYNNYKDAGAVHILAVSGLHVGILLLLLQFLLAPLVRLPKGKTLKLVGVMLLLWGYAFIAGLSPSIVRAVTMFSFVAYAMHLNRPTNSFNILALSMFFILLVKPLFLFQVGFQMSYAAVLAIVWIYPKLQRFWFPEHIVLRNIWQLLSVSAAAQLGVLPISLFYFHQFPALFFVSNLLIIPFLGIILGMGILVLVLSLMDLLPHFLVETYGFVIKTMNTVITWVAKQEGFVIRDIPFDNVQLFLTYFIILVGVSFLSKPKLKNTLAFLVGIIALQTWNIGMQWQLKQKESLLLAHQNRNTVLLHQRSDTVFLYQADSTKSFQIVKDYGIAERIGSTSSKPMRHSFKIAGKGLYVMDSLGIYPPTSIDFLVLTQSPKINLERLIDSINPKMVFADGSNYPSYIARWKQTCLKKEIPFHNTGEKGFYVFE